MGLESFGVVGFDLWPLLQGQTRITKPNSALKVNHLLLVLAVCNIKTNL